MGISILRAEDNLWISLEDAFSGRREKEEGRRKKEEGRRKKTVGNVVSTFFSGDAQR